MKTKAIQLERTGARNPELLKAGAGALLAFLFGSGSLFGAVSPFGVAILAGFPLRYAFPAAIGAALGSLVFSGTGRGGVLALAILIAFGARLLLHRIFRRKLNATALSLLSFTVMAFTEVFYGLLAQVGGLDFALLAIEAVLAGSASYFFAIAGDVLFRREPPVTLRYTQSASLFVLYISAVCSLSAIHILGVNLGVIAGVLSVYLAMNKRGLIGGSIAAIGVAIALSLYSTGMLEFSGMLIIASFLAGAFSPLKKLGQLAAFLTLSVFFVFLMGAPVSLIYRMIEIFLASAAYVLVPERWIDRFGATAQAASPAESSTPQISVSAKLAFASDTIRDLQDELAAVSDRFREIDYNNIGTIYDAAANTVCKGCTKALACWDAGYSDTVGAFNPVSDTLRLNGEITAQTLPAYFREKCCKSEKLCAAINEYYRSFVARQNAKRQVAESRRIVFEQFNSIADMLLEVSEEVSSISSYDSGMARSAIAAWNKLEPEPDQLLCAVDRYGRTRLEVYTTNVVKTSPKNLCIALSEAAGRDFDLPTLSVVQGKTRLSLFEKASYGLEFSAQQSCCRDNPVCGDSYEYFSDAEGYAYLLLSDGMGNGKRAAIDSVMTCSILIKLLKAGFGMPSAIKLLNSSLLVKSADESLATIDLLHINLYTGEAELFKAGAASTFVYSKGEIRRFSSGSLPVGILEGAGYDRQQCRLYEGDIVLMASDGATIPSENWLGDELRKCASLPAKEIAVRLCTEAKERGADLHPDDITILAVKLTKGV